MPRTCLRTYLKALRGRAPMSGIKAKLGLLADYLETDAAAAIPAGDRRGANCTIAGLIREVAGEMAVMSYQFQGEEGTPSWACEDRTYRQEDERALTETKP